MLPIRPIAIDVKRGVASRKRDLAAALGPRTRRYSVMIVLAALSIGGCQSLQKQMTQRSAKCGALCNQAREAREKGNSALANQCIDEAKRQKPRDAEICRQLAETMWTNGRRTEAVDSIARLCEQQPRDLKLATRLAVMQWETEQHDLAAKTAEAVLSQDSQIIDAWRIKARYEVEKGELDEAMVSYNRLSQLSPDDLAMLVELAELHMRRGHPDRACPLFQAAAHHSKASLRQQKEAEWSLGIAYSRCQRWTLAVSSLEGAIQNRTSTADDWCFLAWNHINCGDFESARTALQTALARDPNSVTANQIAMQLQGNTLSAPRTSDVTPTAYIEQSLE